MYCFLIYISYVLMTGLYQRFFILKSLIGFFSVNKAFIYLRRKSIQELPAICYPVKFSHRTLKLRRPT